MCGHTLVCAATHLCVRPHTQPQTPSTSHPIQFMDGYLFIHSFRCSLPSLYFLSLNHQPRTLGRLHNRDLLHLQAKYSGKHLDPKLKTHYVHHIHHPMKVYGCTPSNGGSIHSKFPSMKSIHFKINIWTQMRSVRPHTPVYGRTHPLYGCTLPLYGRTLLCAASHTLLAALPSRTLIFKTIHPL